MAAPEVTLCNLAPMDLPAIDHVGPYMNIGDAFATLGAWLAAEAVPTDGARLVGFFYDNPTTVEASKLRSKAAIWLPEGVHVTPSGAVHLTSVRGGTYAVLRHHGPYEQLAQSWNWLMTQWLPASGHEADFSVPTFEVYLNTPLDTTPDALITDLHMALR